MTVIGNYWQAFAIYRQQVGSTGKMHCQDHTLLKSNLHMVLEEDQQTEPVTWEDWQVKNLENEKEVHMGQEEKSYWVKEGSTM
jgi:hypothetical protein